ncbi:MAG: phosphoribosylformylglycinamidine synthase subunit PurS [Acidimicrobiia bacterium]|nr:phosphoribosylformylglycinamidine synthase subunit PurS [Acidimicrobiia bacterium]
MRIRIDIRRKEGLSDPEGVTTQKALQNLGYDDVTAAHFGRTIYLEMEGEDTGAAKAEVESMCRQLLANPVIEDFDIEVVD